MAAGPSVERDIWQYYQSHYPGQVQVLGPDLFNGQPAQVDGFRTQTGATYPLLLNGGSGTGDEYLYSTYGDRDNWVVINKQGVIRYNAFDYYTYGNRYALGELRATIDSLVSNVTGVDNAAPRAYLLSAAPNPFNGTTTLELTNPGRGEAHARVAVHDGAGRRVATLWDGPAPPGRTTLTWDGRSESGGSMGPGVYVVRAEIGSVRLSRRIVRIR